MNIVRCTNFHFFDSDSSAVCPVCSAPSISVTRIASSSMPAVPVPVEEPDNAAVPECSAGPAAGTISGTISGPAAEPAVEPAVEPAAFFDDQAVEEQPISDIDRDDSCLKPGCVLAGRYEIRGMIRSEADHIKHYAFDTLTQTDVVVVEYHPDELDTDFTDSKYIDGMNSFVDLAGKQAMFASEDGMLRVFDCIRDNNTAYMITEYLDGRTLDEYIRNTGALSAEMAVNLMIPVIRAVSAVHSSGMLHLNICPENIFVTTDDRLKLVSFGAGSSSYSSGYSALEVIGSNDDVSVRSDVYSVGAVLYKMVTGVTPPDAADRLEMISSNGEDPLVLPQIVNPVVNDNKQNAILNAMEMQAANRTTDMEALLGELLATDTVRKTKHKTEVPMASAMPASAMPQAIPVDEEERSFFAAIPLWLKIAVPVFVAAVVALVLLLTGVISFKSSNRKRSSDTDSDNSGNNRVVTKLEEMYSGIEVPNLEGKSIDDAIAELKKQNLQYSIGEVAASDKDANTIIGQEPAAGSEVSRNSRVTLTISRGSVDNKKNKVPYFYGCPSDAVARDLTDAGFECNVGDALYEFSDQCEYGKVLRLALDNGKDVTYNEEYPEGTRIIMYVSKGPQGFSMPDVTNMDEEAAVKALLDKDLVISKIVYEEDQSVESGHVLRQSIASGSIVYKGDPVCLYVARYEVKPTQTPTSTPTPTPVPTKPEESKTTESDPTETKAPESQPSDESKTSETSASETTVTEPSAASDVTVTPDNPVRVTDAAVNVTANDKAASQTDPAYFCCHIPEVTINGIDTSSVNAKIDADLKGLYDTFGVEDEEGNVSPLLGIHYEYSVSSDLISIIVEADTSTSPDPQFYIYNIDSTTGALLSDEELLAKRGIETSSFYDMVRSTYQAIPVYSGLSGKSFPDSETISAYMETTLADDNVMRSRPYVSCDHLCFTGYMSTSETGSVHACFDIVNGCAYYVECPFHGKELPYSVDKEAAAESVVGKWQYNIAMTTAFNSVDPLSFYGVESLSDSNASLEFREDGSFILVLGTNSVTGSYTVSEGVISFLNVGSDDGRFDKDITGSLLLSVAVVNIDGNTYICQKDLVPSVMNTYFNFWNKAW